MLGLIDGFGSCTLTHHFCLCEQACGCREMNLHAVRETLAVNMLSFFFILFAFLPCRRQVWGFETLTSEQRRYEEEEEKEGTGKAGKTGNLLYRKRGRVFPEVGCALDNLSL